jgi:hypothetical protein
MRQILFLFVLLVSVSPVWGQATAAPPDQPAQRQYYLTAKQARERAQRWYSEAEIRDEANKLALRRAQAISWLVNPAAQVSWFGARLYLSPAGNVRSEGPRFALGYGVELFVNPFWALDVVGRVGGLYVVAEDGGMPAANNLETMGALRYTFGGLVVLQAGYLYAMRELRREKSVKDDLLEEVSRIAMHGAYFGGGATFRGVTALAECRIYAGSPTGALRSVVDFDRAWAAFCGVSMLTQPILGF